ncbi:hypothetical protein V8C86DRAFT_1092530 [Haematococcus lacustris]
MGGGASACRDIAISTVSYCIPDLALPTLPTALPPAALPSPDDASPIQLKNGSRANLDKLQEALTSEAAVAAWLEQQGPEWVDGALGMLPALADVLSVVVNVVVPPPGGQVLQIVLQVGAMLVSDQQNLAALASLGRDLSKLMALVLNADTLRALEVKKSTSIALECHEVLQRNWPPPPIGAVISFQLVHVLSCQLYVIALSQGSGNAVGGRRP